MVELPVRAALRAHGRSRCAMMRPERRGRARCEPLEPRRLMAAAPLPEGLEFRVNTHTAASQELFSEAPHAVAADADGNFVVTWSSSGQDGNGWGVYAHRFAADGTPAAGEFRVNQSTAGDQWYPGVACAAGGSFVIVWTSALQDGSGDGVYARRYDAAGAPVGDEFRVNPTTADSQRQATVAVEPDGAFVIAWSGLAQPDGAGWDVYAQRFSAAGVREGGEFRVNTTTAGNQQFAAVAAGGEGFVVTWTSDGQDGGGTAVYARRYDASGAAQGGEVRVNTETAGNQQYSRVAAAPDGGFVIAWASASQDGSGRGVYAQRFAAGGAKLGGEFRVNEVTAGEQFAPMVAADGSGGFVVTWTGAQDGNLFGVFARAYDAAGNSRGNEFRANTFVTGNQVYSSVAAAPDGRAVIVWQSDGQDGSLFGIYGQRYAAPDTTPPTADVVDVAPDPRTGSVDAVTIRFSEEVAGFTVADLRLTRESGLNLLTAAQMLASADGMTYTLSNLSEITALPGSYLLTVVAAGSGIADVSGNVLAANASDGWTVLPAPARVVARHVFYNGSSFDGHDGAAGASDDDAIPADKQALLPGGAAGAANYTSYSRGLNGVMIDVAGWGGVPVALSSLDFACRVGNAIDVGQWAAAPTMTLSVRPGAGVDGSDRVTLVWEHGAISRQWLRVSLLATAVTRLAAPDVFYFGNLPGETVDRPGEALVDYTDFALTRAAVGDGPAGLDSRFDHDRNGRVDVRDLAVVRAAMGNGPLELIGVPGAASRGARQLCRHYRPAACELALASPENIVQ